MEGYLVSRIPVRARLAGRPSSLRKVLASYPWLRKVRDGTRQSYLVDEGRMDRFYEVDFSSSCIELSVHSKSSPLYYMQEAILRLLCLLSALDGLYEPDIRSLYPYLINLLAGDSFRMLSERLRPAGDRGECGSDLVLAKRINALLAENAALKEEAGAMKRSFWTLLPGFLMARFGNEIDVREAATELGMDVRGMEEALSHANVLGYRSDKISGGRVRLVRL